MTKTEPHKPKRPWNQVACLRITSAGELNIEYRFDAEINFWLEFNRRHRPQEALIVCCSPRFPDGPQGELRSLGWADSLEAVASKLGWQASKLLDRRTCG